MSFFDFLKFIPKWFIAVLLIYMICIVTVIYFIATTLIHFITKFW